MPTVLFAAVKIGSGAALWSAAGYLVVNVLVGSIIEPRFMGRCLGLSQHNPRVTRPGQVNS